MAREYITSETDLPEDPGEEVTIQLTDAETREIFTTRGRVSRDRSDLADPEPLTVVRGPHENIEEQWYVEVIEADVDGERVDADLLAECIEESREGPNVINTRSAELRALLTYLVRAGEFDSVSEATRRILREHLAAEHPDLVERYVDLEAERERAELAETLRGEHG